MIDVENLPHVDHTQWKDVSVVNVCQMSALQAQSCIVGCLASYNFTNHHPEKEEQAYLRGGDACIS